MNLDEVQAVIESAKARGTESLERLIRKRLPDATPREVDDATEVAVEIIESVPLFLARASQEAQSRNLTMLVEPILDHAERYFLRPVDLVPEMTHGLAGLLDDTYLVLRVLENLDRDEAAFLDWDLEHPLSFIRRLLEPGVGRKLDALSKGGLMEIQDNLSRYWNHLVHEA